MGHRMIQGEIVAQILMQLEKTVEITLWLSSYFVKKNHGWARVGLRGLIWHAHKLFVYAFYFWTCLWSIG